MIFFCRVINHAMEASLSLLRYFKTTHQRRCGHGSRADCQIASVWWASSRLGRPGSSRLRWWLWGDAVFAAAFAVSHEQVPVDSIVFSWIHGKGDRGREGIEAWYYVVSFFMFFFALPHHCSRHVPNHFINCIINIICAVTPTRITPTRKRMFKKTQFYHELPSNIMQPYSNLHVSPATWVWHHTPNAHLPFLLGEWAPSKRCSLMDRAYEWSMQPGSCRSVPKGFRRCLGSGVFSLTPAC